MSPTTAQQPTYNPTLGRRHPLLPTFPPLPPTSTSTSKVSPLPPATTLAGAAPTPSGAAPPSRSGWIRHAFGSGAIPSSTTSGATTASPMASATPGYSALFGSRSALPTVGPTAGADFANGMSSGPITIANGYTVTVESGGSWSVV